MAGDPSLRLEVVDEVASTSDVLKRRAVAGEGEGALLARRQVAGRGRMGRCWHSGDGDLSLSVLLRPSGLRWPGHWSLLAGVALEEVVRPLVAGRGTLRLKWPNDLLLDGGKLAGILVEGGFTPAPWLVIGFGMNLTGKPAALERPTASLAGYAAPAPEALAAMLLPVLQRWRGRYERDGIGPVRAAWLVAGHAVGEPLEAVVGGVRVAGRFSGLGDDGSLLLDGPGGTCAVSAGELLDA